MNKRWIVILIFSLSALSPWLLNPENQSPPHKLLDVPKYSQQALKWCWAASCEMILCYLERQRNGDRCQECDVDIPEVEKCPIAQCNQVSIKETGRDGVCCCPGCNCCTTTNGWPNFKYFSYRYCSTETPLLWNKLIEQMKNKKPIGFAWRWIGGSDSTAHYMVARGYTLIDDVKLVVVNDPLPVNCNKLSGGTVKIISYEEYKSAEGHHSHKKTNYKIEWGKGDCNEE